MIYLLEEAATIGASDLHITVGMPPTLRMNGSQREIHGDTESFTIALRASLREDTDVILVGEMRDPETIATVITAAETGHLVFATLHTASAAQTIDRIYEEGLSRAIDEESFICLAHN